MKFHLHSLVLFHGRRPQVKRSCEVTQQLRRPGQRHCKWRSPLLVVHFAIRRWNYSAISERTWRRSTTWKRTTPARSAAADLRTSTICSVTWGQFMEWSSALFRVNWCIGSSSWTLGPEHFCEYWLTVWLWREIPNLLGKVVTVYRPLSVSAYCVETSF